MKVILELISLGCRGYLAWLFLYAAHDKVWGPAGFALDMARYDILPMWAINTASVSMAWLELVCGAFLLVGFLTRGAAFWVAGLLTLFTGLMIYAGFTGAGYDCGCFPGQSGHTAGFQAALRDFFMLLPALWLLWKPGNWLKIYP